MNIKMILQNSIISGALVLLTACGDGESASKSGINTLTGTFVDDPVQGID